VGEMSVKKQDLHELIELIDEKYNQSAYDLLRKLINGEIVIIDGMIIECDDSPLTKEEKKAIEEAEENIKNGEYVTLEELKDELNL
jgi:hypothetical protein